MTAQDIIDTLFGPKGFEKPISKGRTQDRLKSAKGYCVRHGMEWDQVLNAMSDDQRKAVQDAEVPRA